MDEWSSPSFGDGVRALRMRFFVLILDLTVGLTEYELAAGEGDRLSELAKGDLSSFWRFLFNGSAIGGVVERSEGEGHCTALSNPVFCAIIPVNASSAILRSSTAMAHS
ncbi:MAG: hypothetical protein ABW168_01655 [Sedimenticola sp.]